MGIPSTVQNSEPIGFAPPDLTPDDSAAVERVLKSGWLTTGEECFALERELSDYLGGVEVIAASSCTAALEIMFAALALPRGSRVGVPTWTFVSTALTPARLGLTPVLLDVDPDTLNVSTESLASAIDAGIDAFVAVHFGGVPVAPAVYDLCARANVPVIEDAAHALGASDHRGRVAGQGTIGAAYSFYATKNLTCGEGGAIATDNPQVASFARAYRLHGLSADAWARHRPDHHGEYDLVAAGIKANLPDLLAALARSQFSRFEAMQARRHHLVSCYRAQLSGTGDVRILPPDRCDGSANHLMVVELAAGIDRAAVRQRLAAIGIATSVHFQPLHRFEWFAEHASRAPGGTPNAERAADHVLSLPLSSSLTESQVDRVCESLKAVLTSAG
jgi:dTDP-4-amino-4,6-dideoxygalactose transaminase